MTMPAVPRIVGLFGLVLILAVALIFLPTILNIGGTNPPAASTAPSAGVGVGPSASVAPTVPPAPTPSVYTIKKGETLSKIATAHGITIEELLAANPQIKNPNRISEGQQITIPAPSEAPPEEVGGSAEPS
jgi:LysM repeat protein